jgi:predicted RNA binding protein YcfA (HicA-like mRNA interferase family)
VDDGKVQFGGVSMHGMNDDLKPNTLASMIRQSGLPKARFRN